MKEEIGIEELRKIQLEVLDAFVAYCEKHKLRYYLAYGTLLGAVRHKGYIPWDDDIDIAMPKPDYDFFVKDFNTHGSAYMVRDYAAFVKVCDGKTLATHKGLAIDFHLGVNIDVLPICGLPEGRRAQERLIRKVCLLNRFYYMKIWKCSFFLTRLGRAKLFCFKIVSFWLSHTRIAGMVKRMISRYDYSAGSCVAMTAAPYGINEIMPRKVFDEVVDVEFEGRKYKAPVLYREYLSRIYGDYMQLPPLEQRTVHSFKAYRL